MADASTDTPELSLAFASADELQAAYEGLLSQRRCFVPAARPLASGAKVRFGLTVPSLGMLHLLGRVAFNDVDAFGKPGVVLDLESGEIARVRALLDARHDDPIGAAPTRLMGGRTEPGLSQAGETLEPGALLDNRFQIEAHLASGGMGEVYRAQHVFLKRPVAVKLLRRALVNEPSMWARFQREAELVSRLESPHVVRVFDFGRTADGQPYLAMEFVEGDTLERALQNSGAMPPERAVELAVQLCEGLSEAHALGIVHRDLKPSNVVLGKKRDGSTVAKLLDFGVARPAGRPSEQKGLTELGIIVGTPAYMAPEQAVGDALDARTDLYALGCVIFEMLTGQPPFTADSLQGLVTAHLSQAAPGLAQVRPELSQWPQLDEVVQRCLAKDRAQRIESAAALARALQQALAPSAQAAWPPPADAGPQEWSASPAPAPAVALAPPEWRMTPAPLPGQAPPLATPAPAPDVDDFFSATPAKTAPTGRAEASARPPAAGHLAAATARPPVTGRLAEATARLKVPLVPGVLEGLKQQRSLLGGDSSPGALVRLELLRARPDTALFRACAARLLALAFEREALVDTLDEDALLAFFPGEARQAAGRAAAFALSAREVVHDESRGATPGATLRAALVTGRADFPSGDAPLAGDLPELSRQVVAKVPAGVVGAEPSTASAVGDLAQLREGAGFTELVERRPTFDAGVGPLLGRDKVLGALDARLKLLAYEKVAPLVVRGRPGSGKTALAQELTLRARHRSYVVGQARSLFTAGATQSELPYGALVDLLCNLCGVPREQRHSLLAPALTGLALPPGEQAAALALAGLVQLPAPFTPGQAVRSLRAVLDAGAPNRKRVLVFDGLESMDPYSVSAFLHLCTHGLPGEMVVGLADASFAQKRLQSQPTLELSPLTVAEVGRWLAGQAGEAGCEPALSKALAERSHGLPGLLVDWLSMLADRGELRRNAKGQLALNVARLPDLDPERLPEARAAALPVPVFRLLEAVTLAGDGVEGAFLAALLPDMPPVAYQRLVASRMLRALGGRRWAVASERYRAGVLARDDGRRPALHAKLAELLVTRGRAKVATQGPVDARVLASHLLKANDGARALAAFRHLAERAVQQRAFRDLAEALEGSADALALLGKSGQVKDAFKGQLDMLSRAASVQLVLSDAAAARRLLDEAQVTAQSGVTSVEHELARAKVLRSEARRAKAAEALEVAETLALGTPWLPLCKAERAEAEEAEGDLERATQSLEDALSLAASAQEMARWHGEVDLQARLLARLGGVWLSRKDVQKARAAYEESLAGWRRSHWPYAEARVLANLGALLAQSGAHDEARARYEEAAQVAEASGDYFFLARALLNLAGVEKLAGATERRREAATRAVALAASLGWEEGRRKAEGLT